MNSNSLRSSTAERRMVQYGADQLREPVTDQNGPIAWRGSAAQVQDCYDQEWMIAGPAETGKTWAALWKLDNLMRSTPKAKAALVRKVAADIPATVLQTWYRVLERSGSGAEPYGGKHRPSEFVYPNGAVLYIGGMDRASAVLSGERDFVYVNQAEELSLNDWETLSTRTTGRGAVTDTPMLFGDCNPGPPSHWILARQGLKLFHSQHKDNPSLYRDDGSLTAQGERTMKTLSRLTGIRRERLFLGRWVAAEGTVYEFDRARHLLPRFDIPKDWARYRAIDWGYTNPFVCQWWAVDGDGRMYLYREIYMSRRTVRKHAGQIKDLERWTLPDGETNPDRERIAGTIADHDAEDRETLREEGIPSRPANKAITVGIQKVQERLQDAEDGRPRLFVLEGSLVELDQDLVDAHQPTSTLAEFDEYAWPKGQDGKAVKEVPVDAYNHGMDAMRYMAMRLDRSYQNTALGAFS